MRPESSDAVRQVLREASDHASFAGWSFAERLVWMIDRGYELGRRDVERSTESAATKNDGSGNQT
jgi:hypothetical protein